MASDFGGACYKGAFGAFQCHRVLRGRPCFAMSDTPGRPSDGPEAEEYLFGPFRLNASDRLLVREGATVHLTPKAADTLLALLRRRNHVVSKDELIRDVWHGAFVADGTLAFHVYLVRQALRDGADGQRYIETLPRRGYRFVAPVRRADEGSPAPATFFRDTDARIAPTPIALAALTSLLIWIAVVRTARDPVSIHVPHVIGFSQLTRDRRLKAEEIPLLNDGTEIYFAPHGEITTMRVRIEGGEIEAVPGVPPDTRIVDVSDDGSAYLAIRYVARDTGELWTGSRKGGMVRRVGSFLVQDASWSPDRKRIAFVSRRALWIAQSDGTRPTRVGQFAGSVECPRWSPDGRLLRFKLNGPDDSFSSALWQVAIDGSSPHALLPAWKDSYIQGCGAWMRGGRGFIFDAVDTRDPSQPGVPPPQGRRDLWVLPEGSDRPLQLTAGPMSFAAPAPSADGHRIFALGVHRRAELVRFDQRLRDFVPYLGGLSARWINFSKDGQRIVYLRHPDDVLCRSNLDGTAVRQLTFSPLEADAPAWSPDEKWIAFRGRLPGQHMKIYLMSADGGSPFPITPDDVEQGMATWSPDGSRIAFGDVPARYEQPTGAEVIHLYDINTRRSSTVPESRGLWTARWSRDGRYLAALTIRGQRVRIFDLWTSKWRSVRDEHVEEPAWSNDGKYIFHTTEGQASKMLVRLRVADGVVEPLTKPDEFPTTTPDWIWAGVAFDGSPIVLRRSGPVEVYALRIDWR